MKAVSDLFAPVSGTVTEINEALNTTPEQVNKDANTTWMIKVTLKDSGDVEPVALRRRLREVRGGRRRPLKIGRRSYGIDRLRLDREPEGHADLSPDASSAG